MPVASSSWTLRDWQQSNADHQLDSEGMAWHNPLTLLFMVRVMPIGWTCWLITFCILLVIMHFAGWHGSESSCEMRITTCSLNDQSVLNSCWYWYRNLRIHRSALQMRNCVYLYTDAADKRQHNIVEGSSNIHGRRLVSPSADILLGRTAVPLLLLLTHTTGLSCWNSLLQTTCWGFPIFSDVA